MSPLFSFNGKLIQKQGKLGANEKCCCGDCWEVTVTFVGGGDGMLRECSPQVKETQNLTIPDYVCIPACAQISWSADDDVAINDVRVNGTWDQRAEGCVFGDACCASAGSRRMCIDSRQLKIDLIDTVGVGWGGYCTIKICATDCGCETGSGGDCVPSTSGSGSG